MFTDSLAEAIHNQQSAATPNDKPTRKPRKPCKPHKPQKSTNSGQLINHPPVPTASMGVPNVLPDSDSEPELEANVLVHVGHELELEESTPHNSGEPNISRTPTLDSYAPHDRVDLTSDTAFLDIEEQPVQPCIPIRYPQRQRCIVESSPDSTPELDITRALSLYNQSTLSLPSIGSLPSVRRNHNLYI